MSAVDYVEPLRAYVAETHLDGRADLTADTPLLEWGVIDSLALPDLLEHIEGRFGIEVPPAEVTPDNFATLTALGALLERLDGAAG
jgi:acyl carrier protein